MSSFTSNRRADGITIVQALRACCCALFCTASLLLSAAARAQDGRSGAKIGAIVIPEEFRKTEASGTPAVRSRPNLLKTGRPPERKSAAYASLANQEESQAPERLAAPESDLCQPLPPITSIRDLTTQIEPSPGELPVDCAVHLRKPEDSIGTFFGSRLWAATEFNWEASSMCHEPVYFEEPNLERYGYSVCPPAQPAISAAHFFSQLPVLPYKIGLDPPHVPVYDLGFERPGDPAPFRCPRIPISCRAVATEAAFVTGLVFFIP